MNTQRFIEQALQHGIQLSVCGDRLDVDAPREALTDDVIDYMRQHKQELISALTKHGPCFQCGENTRCMLTRPDGSWDWMCVSCFDRGATI